MKQIATAFALSLIVAAPVAAQTAPTTVDMAVRAIAASEQVVVFGTDRAVMADQVIERFNADADGQDGRITRPGNPVAGTPLYGAEIFDRLRAESRGR